MATALGTPPRLVGRDDQLRSLSATIAGASRQESPTLLISGAAGIGKTSVVARALADASTDVVVLRGTCLPLESSSLGLLPLRGALRTAPTPKHLNAACLRSIDEGRPIEGLDAYLDAVTASSPVVVFIDDVQWADQGTLDVLLYLAAAPRAPGFAVIATVRSDSSADDHRVQRWLADVLRLPRVEHQRLQPLDRRATEAQLTQLLGTMPHQSLLEEIFGLTRGNPYFTSLLARGLRPATRHVPSALPTDLVLAVTRAALVLPSPVREVASLLAVAGRPTTATELAAVAVGVGLSDISDELDEAEDAGLLEGRAAGRYWFRHPLQAEAMAAALPPGRRRRWHGAFARHLEQTLGTGDAWPELAAALVAQHELARQPQAAYRWAMVAWDLADSFSRPTTLLPVVRRAVALRDLVPDAARSVDAVWLRWWRTAQRAGAEEDELAAIEQLVLRIDPDVHPLVVSELLVRRTLLEMSTGMAFVSTDGPRRAVQLASVDTDSWQYALALAELVHCGTWNDDSDATDLAEQALRLARRTGHPKALSFASTAHAMVSLGAGRRATAFADASAAVGFAAEARDWWGFVHAAMWESNAQVEPGGPDDLRRLRQRRDQLAALGATHDHVARISSVEAGRWLMAGEWPECESCLRVTLAADPGVLADVRARLTAAQLAAWQGRVETARAHLDRAEELVPNLDQYRNLGYEAVHAMVLMEERRSVEAFEVASAAVDRGGVAPHLCEWLVPTGCRALADQALAARDAGDAPATSSTLDAFRASHPRVLVCAGDDRPGRAVYFQALQSWCDAEVARARAEAGCAGRWAGVADAAELTGLRWLEAYARWRSAEASLGSGDRGPAGVRTLRRAYALASRLPAGSVLAELRVLGAGARITLDAETLAIPESRSLPGLTGREREILGHLVAGETYAEIADQLMISGKTVSSHVSNMLRKTGTTSRVELSLRVRRIGLHRTG